VMFLPGCAKGFICLLVCSFVRPFVRSFGWLVKKIGDNIKSVY